MDISIPSARIGGVRSSFPGSKLSVTPSELVFKVTLLGTYKFAPTDIIGFEPNKGLYGGNIFIKHNVADYPEKISLNYKGEAKELTQLLNEHGFIPSGIADSSRLRKGIAVRWVFLIAAILLFSALLFCAEKHKDTIYSIIAVALTFAAAIMIPKSEALQQLILKPDRRVGEIVPILSLLKWISGILLAFSLISYFMKNI